MLVMPHAQRQIMRHLSRRIERQVDLYDEPYRHHRSESGDHPRECHEGLGLPRCCCVELSRRSVELSRRNVELGYRLMKGFDRIAARPLAKGDLAICSHESSPKISRY